MVEEIPKPKPSKFKAKLKNYGIPISHAATFLGYSYPHFLNIINGISSMPPVLEERLQKLFLEVEQKRGASS